MLKDDQAVGFEEKAAVERLPATRSTSTSSTQPVVVVVVVVVVLFEAKEKKRKAQKMSSDESGLKRKTKSDHFSFASAFLYSRCSRSHNPSRGGCCWIIW